MQSSLTFGVSASGQSVSNSAVRRHGKLTCQSLDSVSGVREKIQDRPMDISPSLATSTEHRCSEEVYTYSEVTAGEVSGLSPDTQEQAGAHRYHRSTNSSLRTYNLQILGANNSDPLTRQCSEEGAQCLLLLCSSWPQAHRIHEGSNSPK